MPELPEVEIVRQGLEQYLLGKQIKELEVRVPKLFSGDPSALSGATIISIERRAKVLMLVLDTGMTLLVHLKMTGQLVYQSPDEREKVVGGHPQKSYNQPLPHNHTHIIFFLTDGSHLYFNDLRKFGWIQLVPSESAVTHGMLKTIGPEPLAPDFTVELLMSRLKKYPNRMIYVSLLDQVLIAGLGNIYVNEALYEAGILPERRIADIHDDEWPKLWTAIRHVLEVSIAAGGTSDSTYVHVDGRRGDYLQFAHVYHKKVASPCGHEVVRKKIGGRTVHFCPIDQI